MDTETFSTAAALTAIYPNAGEGWTSGVIYTALGLAGEAGEVTNQVKKIIRDDDLLITPVRKEKILDELGDVLWYAARLATELGTDLGSVMQDNINKLSRRQREGTLHGDKRE